MAASKVQANWVDCSHGSVDITRDSSVSFDTGGSIQSFMGDDDRYPTLVANLSNQPKGSITSADTATLMGIATGTIADFTATHKDAIGATGGAIVYTFVNACAENTQTSGNHGAFGSATFTFVGYSVDGQTNPLSFTRV